MSGEDWLPALDDAFTFRLTACTLCGGRHDAAWFDIWPGPPAMGFVLCSRCREVDPERQALAALLQRRYAGRETS